MTLANSLRDRWRIFQGELFPEIRDEVGPLTKNYESFIHVLELVHPERFIQNIPQRDGRPEASRRNLLKAFLAKAFWDIPTTRGLVERLQNDRTLRNLCGWVDHYEIPSESTFSRAFAEFAESDLPGRMHEAMVKEAFEDRIVGHISRDSTAISAREKPAPKAESEQEPEKEKRKRGRPRKDEARAPKEETRLDRQASGNMTLEQMLDDLPKACDVGAKADARGYKKTWVGYKLHIDTADGGFPISCILSSASMHDSQASIPLADMTDQRVTYLYECMDSAYDAAQIHEHSTKNGHVSIIDSNPRRNKGLKADQARERKASKAAGFVYPETQRYKERSNVERVNGRLKDEFGARHLRVRGHEKVYAHLMLGVVLLCADQLMRLLI